jgi:guanylate kinase
MAVVLVIAGPSGTGKGTIVRRLLEDHPELWFSVSATDRPPRPGERDGVDYLFVSRDEFERMRDEGQLLEWFEVFGDLKGTPRGPIEEHLADGEDVLLEVDVKGALAVRQALPQALLVFVKPPSREVQRERLLARAEADAERSGEPVDLDDIERRLADAAAEEALADQFDAVIVNDNLDRAVADVETLLAARGTPGGESP